MANESLEGFIQQKIQALKNQKSEVNERINKAVGPLLREKDFIDKEIGKLNKLIKDFKNGVDPLATKVNIAKGGRRKA